MLLSQIQVAIFTRVRDASGLLPVIYDGEADGTYQSGQNPYIRLSVVPIDNQERVYCDSVLRSGFILATIMAPDGYGANEPTIQAEKVLALFPENLEFGGITVPDLGDIKGALKSDRPGWFYVSTLIYFEAT